MAIVEIHNLYSKVIDASSKALKALDDALAVETPGHMFTASYRSGLWDGMTRFYQKRGNKFPTGLLSEAVMAMRRAGEEVEIVDKRNIIEVNIPDEIKLKHKELGEITLRDYQYESVKKGLEATRGIINVATNGGKCVPKDTLVLTPEGYKTIEQIFMENGTPCEIADKAVETEVVLINRYGKPERASHLTFNGVKPVIKTTLNSGIELKSTYNHPLLTVNENGDFEWKNTEDIKVGDMLVTRIGDNIYGSNNTINEHEAYCVGALLADAYIGKDYKIGFTNDQPVLLDIIEEYFKTLNPTSITREYNKRSINSITVVQHGKESTINWHNRLGIGYGVAKDKHVPQCIMEAPKSVQLSFLSGYLECECHIDVSRPRMEVASASKKLMTQIQLMLKNMGVMSSLRIKKQAKGYYYRLTIATKYLVKLLSMLEFKTEQRQNQAIKSVSNYYSKSRRPDNESVPNGKALITMYKDGYKNIPSGAKKKMHVPNNISRDRMRELLYMYPDGPEYIKDKIEALIDDNLYFDKVVSIEYVGEEPTFDVCMPETHSFIASSVVNHNTEIACGMIQTILPHIDKNDRIVFFTHSKEIFSQSHKRIQERLGIKVGRIGDGKWEEEQVTVAMIPTITKYLKKPESLPKTKKYKELSEKIDLMMIKYASMKDKEQKKSYKEKIDAARQELEEYTREQWDKINENVDKTNEFLNSIVCFIGDEVHHASSDTWYQVFMSLERAYFRFGLTGTVDESNKINVKRLLGCTGKVITKISNEFLIDRGYSAKPTIYMMSLGNINPIEKVSYAEARRMGIIECRGRNQKFVDKILERAKSGKQCLVIVNETEHGEIILDMLEDSGVTVKFTHGEKSSKYRDEVLQELREGKLRILIATSILDEGVDVSGINCLFLVAGGKSMRQLLQRIGRGLRKKEDGSGLEVYDALDYHNEYLVDHTLERYHTYRDEGFEIVKLP